MKAYVICVIATTIINWFAEIALKNKRKALGFLLLSISMFLFCYIAGVRDITVGTDVRGYVLRLANVAAEKNFLSYILSPNSHALFGVLIYIGYLFRNFNFLLFLIEFAVCLPIYIYAYKMRTTASMSMLISIFALTMYCTSYNLIRQSIAISILILAYYYYTTGERKKSFILIGTASLFHITALVFVTVLIMMEIVKKKSKKKYLYLCICYIGASVFTIFAEYFIALTKFNYYIGNTAYMRDFSVGSILKQIFWVVLAVVTFSLGKKGMQKNSSCNDEAELSIYLFLLSTLFVLMSFKIPGLGRLGYYFYDLAIFIFLPILCNRVKPRWIITLLVYVFMFYLWWHMTCVPNDSAGVYPYKSEILYFLN